MTQFDDKSDAQPMRGIFSASPTLRSQRHLVAIVIVSIASYVSLYALLFESDSNGWANQNNETNPSKRNLSDSAFVHTLTAQFSIHIFINTGLNDFWRLWQYVNHARPINASVTFNIHVKHSKSTLLSLKPIQSPHGEVKVLPFRGTSMRDVMIDAWTPTIKREFGVFMDSDATLSANFLDYSLLVAQIYLSAPKTKCFGFSMQDVDFDLVHNLPWHHNITDSPLYALQFPSTRTAIIAPVPWIKFRKWRSSLPPDFNPLLPNSMTNRWDHQASLRKHIIRFMYSEGWFMLYPAQSTETSAVSSAAVSHPLKETTRNEVFLRKLSRFRMDMKIKTFNCYFELVQGPESLLSLPVAPHCFDKCTLIMNVYDRTSSLLDRIRHYHTFAKLDSIIIVWNHQTLKPPQWIFRDAVRNNGSNVDVVSGELNVPLHILLQSNSSLNNRYIPFREIHTDCVISMDDDFDYPHRHLDYAIQLFQGEFFNNLIGFKHMARAHRKKVDNTWEYLTEIDRGMSMVLPTGAVFHRKYLEMYSFQLPSLARDIVDSKNNGEDILFNMMVANATGMAPVVVNLFSRGIKMPGLWKKAGHFESRSLCLTRLINEIFGGRSPLKYSFSTFRGVDKDGLTPSLKELQSYDKVNWIR